MQQKWGGSLERNSLTVCVKQSLPSAKSSSFRALSIWVGQQTTAVIRNMGTTYPLQIFHHPLLDRHLGPTPSSRPPPHIRQLRSSDSCRLLTRPLLVLGSKPGVGLMVNRSTSLCIYFSFYYLSFIIFTITFLPSCMFPSLSTSQLAELIQVPNILLFIFSCPVQARTPIRKKHEVHVTINNRA